MSNNPEENPFDNSAKGVDMSFEEIEQELSDKVFPANRSKKYLLKTEDLNKENVVFEKLKGSEESNFRDYYKIKVLNQKVYFSGSTIFAKSFINAMKSAVEIELSYIQTQFGGWNIRIIKKIESESSEKPAKKSTKPAGN